MGWWVCDEWLSWPRGLDVRHALLWDDVCVCIRVWRWLWMPKDLCWVLSWID